MKLLARFSAPRFSAPRFVYLLEPFLGSLLSRFLFRARAQSTSRAQPTSRAEPADRAEPTRSLAPTFSTLADCVTTTRNLRALHGLALTLALTLLLTLLLSALPAPAHAAEWKSSFNADLEAEGLYWNEGKLGPDQRLARGIFTVKTPATIRRGREWRLKVLPIAQVDPLNASSREKFFWDVQEGYLQWQNLPWTIQLGMNVFTWGDTDIFNPLDVVNARRYYDPFRSEKLGAPALVVKRDFEHFFAEAIYIPQQRRTMIPGENSRWLPRQVYRVRSVGFSGGLAANLILPNNLRYTYTDPVEQENALNHNIGLRMKFRLPNFDWTIAAFQGAALAPDVRLRKVDLDLAIITADRSVFTASVLPDIVLQPSYYPIRMTGTSFTAVFGSLLVKGAAAYTHTLFRRFTLPARTWENVLALEQTIPLGTGTITAVVQGTYVDRGDRLDTNVVSLARMFDRGLMGALRWAPNEVWTGTASYLSDVKYKGTLWHGEATYKITDGWRAKLSGDFLDGEIGTPLGTFAKNDRVTASLLSQF